MKSLKENRFNIIIALAILLISFSFSYYFIIFIPRQEQKRLNQEVQEQLSEEQQRIKNKESLDKCIKDAGNILYTNLQSEGIESCNEVPSNEIYDCGVALSEKLKEDLVEARDSCLKKYPQK